MTQTYPTYYGFWDDRSIDPRERGQKELPMGSISTLEGIIKAIARIRKHSTGVFASMSVDQNNSTQLRYSDSIIFRIENLTEEDRKLIRQRLSEGL